MDDFDLQRGLAALGLYAGKIDGDIGPKSTTAIDVRLSKVRADGAWREWSLDRRMIAVEQSLYADAGIEVGAIDGLVGEQTRFARQVWQARKDGLGVEVETWRDADANKPPLIAPPPAATVWPRQADVPAFFGAVGANQVLMTMPFPLRLAWDTGTIVTRVSCHAKVREPLERIWTGALAHYGASGLREARLDLFGGCLNVRKMRGGSSYSMHAWGIAWDVDPDRNQLAWGRDRAALDAATYEPFWRLVEGAGGVSLGRARNYDWMHFQFARV